MMEHDKNRVPKRNGKKGGYLLATSWRHYRCILVVVAISNFPNFSIGGNEDLKKIYKQLMKGLTNEKIKGTKNNRCKCCQLKFTKAVDKVGDAVVGITNIQSVGFWNEVTHNKGWHRLRGYLQKRRR